MSQVGRDGQPRGVFTVEAPGGSGKQGKKECKFVIDSDDKRETLDVVRSSHVSPFVAPLSTSRTGYTWNNVSFGKPSPLSEGSVEVGTSYGRDTDVCTRLWDLCICLKNMLLCRQTDGTNYMELKNTGEQSTKRQPHL